MKGVNKYENEKRNKFLLVSAICTISIPSVSYAEETISPKNVAISSRLYEEGNIDVLKSSFYPNTYTNPFNYRFISMLKEPNTNIKEINHADDENPVISTTLTFIRNMHTENYKSAFDLTSRPLQKIISEK